MINKKILLVALVFSVAITVSLVLVRQDVRQRAQESSTALTESDWKTSDELIRSGELEEPKKILEVTLSYNANQNPKFKILKTEKKNGYLSPEVPEDHKYELELLDANQNVVKKTIIKTPLLTHVAKPEDEKKLEENADLIVRLPWFDNVTSLRIVDIPTNQTINHQLNQVKDVNNKPKFKTLESNEKIDPEKNSNKIINFIPNFIRQTFAQEDQTSPESKLDIVFIRQGYDYNTFVNDVNRFSEKLLQIEPFRSRPNHFRFHYLLDDYNLDCARGGIVDFYYKCNIPKALSIAGNAGVPMDKLVILVNAPDKGAYTDIGYGTSVMHNGVGGSNYNLVELTFVHEMGGHAIGKLGDEYVYPSGTTLYKGKNCFDGMNPPNPEWAGLVPDNSYFIECASRGWWRSSKESIMRDEKISSEFNVISQKLINDQINYYAPYVEYIPPTDGQLPIEVVTPTLSPEVCNDRVDNNGNGQIDENCPVTSGQLSVTAQCVGTTPIIHIFYPGYDPLTMTSHTVLAKQLVGSSWSLIPPAFEKSTSNTHDVAVVYPGKYRVEAARVYNGSSFVFYDDVRVDSVNCAFIPSPTSILTPTVQATLTPTPTKTPTPTIASIPTSTVKGDDYWRTEFFNNTTVTGSPKVISNDSNIDFNWGTASPKSSFYGINSDFFSVKWTRNILFEGGNYTFNVSHDDGMRVYIDQAIVYDYWIDRNSAFSYTFSKKIAAGVHNVVVTYYDSTGNAAAKFGWSKSGSALPTNTPAPTVVYQPVATPTSTKTPTPTPTRIPTPSPTVTPIPTLTACSVSTSPLAYNLNLGSSAIVSASINGLGSAYVIQMNFGSYNTNVATVNPTVDTLSPYQTTVSAISGGIAAVWGTVYLSDGRVCQSTGSTDTDINVLLPTPTPTRSVTPTQASMPTPTQTVPTDYWRAEFFNNKALSGNPIYATTATNIDFNWGSAAPPSSFNIVTSDNFSARWTKNVYFEAGEYLFSASHDDGLLIYFDQENIYNKWTNSIYPWLTYSFTKTIPAGYHTVKIEYFENTGNASVKINWAKR